MGFDGSLGSYYHFYEEETKREKRGERMKGKQFLQILKVVCVRNLLRLLWLIPIRARTVFFSAYEGKQYSCNPRAVFEAMISDSRFAGFQYVWELNDTEKKKIFPDASVRFVQHNTLRYVFAVMTSKVLITNSGISGTIPLRRKQLNINTWHGGGAYKRVGYGMRGETLEQLFWLELASNQTNFYISSSRSFTEVMTQSVHVPEKHFLPYGMPRNDMFFYEEANRAARERVLTKYGIKNSAFVILYAPTYRGIAGSDRLESASLDVSKIKSAVWERFHKDAVILIRMHYFNRSANIGNDVVAATYYPDMQDLLAASDMLITDYSSSIWDFALTRKPTLLFVPDLQEYDTERGFYTPPTAWPGILCETKEELCSAITGYEEEIYINHIEQYLREAGSYETGEATDKLKQFVIDCIEEVEYK